MSRHDLCALLHLFKIGARKQWEARAMLASGIMMLVLLIALWGALWLHVDAATLARYELNSAKMIWYLSLSETVIFAASYFHREVIAQVREGHVTSSLTRPLSYPLLSLAEVFGQAAMRLVIFGAVAITTAYAMGGAFPSPEMSAIFLPLSLALSCGILIVGMLILGLSALWLPLAEPLSWMVQKLIFVFGGLVVPVSVMPFALKAVGWATPFPAVLYAPASFVIDSSPGHVAAMIGIQAAWGLGMAWIAAIVWSAAVRKMMREG